MYGWFWLAWFYTFIYNQTPYEVKTSPWWTSGQRLAGLSSVSLAYLKLNSLKDKHLTQGWSPQPQYLHTNSPDRSTYISLEKKLREFDERSKHFFPLVIILSILITYSLYNVWILFGLLVLTYTSTRCHSNMGISAF